ncbi:M43 family zinc metalloprotease [Vicingaceae bacterium]|nr:M43 family zinc metalloprotease [Vicingaceae bacterium]MDC0004898.1 M43 family zinc metalloprotease [bacterium]MDC1452205.1 M43 family zinc metalloprotease [Vicingaceae bacterium]
MKKNIANLLLIALFVVITKGLIAQQTEWCATDQMLLEFLEANPEVEESFWNDQIRLSEFSQLPTLKGAQNNKAPIITVPVVVHVIQYNGIGNITKQQIDDGIRVLNEDFQKLNADTARTRTIFRNIAADSQIEFKLANIDPNGRCTEGVNRINSYLTYNKRNEVKALSYWPSTQYLNVWLVNSILGSGNGTTLGYAQFPNSGNLSTYGLVCRNDQWGNIGTAVGTGGRTATHEVGHCFGLFHPFQGNCGSSCNGSGDFVCDTPPTSGQTFGCNYNNNTCSNDASGGSAANPNPFSSNVPDQLENYMSYDDCQSLFTEGQKSRMLAAFNIYSQLINLKSNGNLVATGTNNGYITQNCPPKANIFDDQQKLVCLGGQLSFSEDSYQGDTITAYNWSFPGATPSTSTAANPTVTYSTAGEQDVTLIVTNNGGSDTLVMQDYVNAKDPAAAYNGFGYAEGFESLTGFNNDWIIFDPTGSFKWARTQNGSLTGNSSVFLQNYNLGSGESDFLISPSIDLTQVVNPRFGFDVAFKNQTGSSDQLWCAISTDCGATWTTRGVISASSLNTGTLNNSFFIPSSPSDWRTIFITTTAAMRTSSSVLFRFEFKSGGGNNIYIDDFRVDGASSLGISDNELLENSFIAFPNPITDGQLNINFMVDKASENARLYLTNMVGQQVKEVYNGSLNSDPYSFEINTNNLSSGIYFVTLRTKSQNITRKIIIH